MADAVEALRMATVCRLLSRESLESYPLDSYAAKLQSALREILSSCCCGQENNHPTCHPSSCLVRIGAQRLKRAFARLPWIILCDEHDEMSKATTTTADSVISPLTVLLQLLRNNSVGPLALLATAACPTIIRTLTALDQQQKSPSRTALLDFIMYCLGACPAIWDDCFVAIECHTGSTSLSAIRNPFRFLQTLFVEFPSKRICIFKRQLYLLAQLDHIPSTLRVNETRNERPASTFDWQYLHGETDDPNIRLRKRRKIHPTKQLLASTEASDWMEVQKETARVLARLRSNVQLLCLSNNGLVPRSSNTIELIINVVLEVIQYLPNSPLVRLFMWFFCDPEYLLGVVWAQCCSSNNLHCLRYYAELLVEHTRFDDPERLRDGLNPLVEYIEDRMDHTNQHTQLRPFLQCFAFLLSRRVHVQDLFGEFITQLSLCIDDPREWFDDTTPCQERTLQLCKLQSVGILGSEVEQTADNGTEEASLSFPLLDHQSTLRDTVRRLRPWLPSPFCCEEHCFLAKPDRTSLLQGRALLSPKKQAASTVPVEFTSDSMQHVFLFLNHKRLRRMRVVCKTWRDAADGEILWKQLYIRRFGKPLHDEKTTLPPWKKLFKQQFRASRTVRFQTCRSDSSWKVCICRYVGCFQVLATPYRSKRHYEMHAKKAAKKTVNS